LGKVVVLNCGFRPELLHQDFFFQQVAAVLDQQEERIEGLRSQADDFLAMGQDALRRIQAVRAKPEKRPFLFGGGPADARVLVFE